MKITVLGKAALFLVFLTLWNAVNGGLNTLYLIASALIAAMLVSWALVRIASALVAADVRLPDQLFAGEAFALRIAIRNRAPFPLFGVAVVRREGRVPAGDLPARGRTEIAIPFTLPRRGLADVTDLALEFGFPFGLLVRRRRIPLRGLLAFPQLTAFAGRPPMAAAAMEEVARPRRGAGDEFWGIREYAPGDDVRLISWKLTAKLGRPLIREFAEMVGDRIVVRVEGSPAGAEAERRIREAASVARHFIDEGAEVKLATDEGETGFGRGLLHLQTILAMLALLGEGKQARPTGEPAPPPKAIPAMAERAALRWATWAMAAVVAASLWIVAGLDPVTKIVVSAAVPLGFLLDRRRWHPVPPALLNVLNVAAIALVLFVDIPIAGLLPGLTHLIAWALVNRLVSPKTARDSATIAFVLFLLFLLVTWQTIDPAYFAAYITFIAAMGAWLAAASGTLPALTARRGIALGFAVLAVLMFAGAVFAATPRVANPHFAKMMRRLGLTDMVAPELSIVKLADRVTLGVFDDVRANGRRVMQVKLSGIAVPPGTALYVRGGALDRFDGREWTRSRFDFFYRYLNRAVQTTNGRALYERDGDRFKAGGAKVGARPIVQEFYVYPMATSVLFSVGDPTAVEGAAQPTYDLTGTAYAAQSFDEGGRYVVFSKSLDVQLDESIWNYGEALERLFLELPATGEMETVRRIAAEIAGAAQGPEAKAQALEKYFRENFVYSYLGRHGRQSLAAFLTETRAANCEYFASAMALMLRAQGVPARLVVGYVSTDWKQVAEFFDVRNSDGHAWVEAYVPGRGWVAYDPTPDVVGPLEFALPFGREVYLYYLNLQMSWYRYVIGYDFYLQQDALGAIIARWRDIAAALALATIAVAAAVAVALLLRTYVFIGRRRLAVAPATAAYLDAERRLSRYGFRRAAWQTPGEFALQVAAVEPRLSAIGALTRAYYRWRYAGTGKDEALKALAELKAALRRYGEAAVRFRR